jgi:rhodanese-related sulfurtransferase
MNLNTVLNILIVGVIGYFVFNTFFTNGYEKLDQATAYAELQSDQSIQLVDVREPSEFNAGYIEGAQLIPLGTIETDFEVAIPDKDAKIFVYCRSGNRSAQAAKKLVDLGYTNVFDIGGILDWQYGVVNS